MSDNIFKTIGGGFDLAGGVLSDIAAGVGTVSVTQALTSLSGIASTIVGALSEINPAFIPLAAGGNALTSALAYRALLADKAKVAKDSATTPTRADDIMAVQGDVLTFLGGVNGMIGTIIGTIPLTKPLGILFDAFGLYCSAASLELAFKDPKLIPGILNRIAEAQTFLSDYAPDIQKTYGAQGTAIASAMNAALGSVATLFNGSGSNIAAFAAAADNVYAALTNVNTAVLALFGHTAVPSFSVTRPAGNTTTITDTANTAIAATATTSADAAGDTTYSFANPAGTVLQKETVDANGALQNSFYDPAAADAMVLRQTQNDDGSGSIVSGNKTITYTDDNAVSVTANTSGYVATVSDPDGTSTAYTYAPDTASGAASPWTLIQSDQENVNGTSALATDTPAGSSVAITYSGPNGTGGRTGSTITFAGADMVTLANGKNLFPSGMSISGYQAGDIIDFIGFIGTPAIQANQLQFTVPLGEAAESTYYQFNLNLPASFDSSKYMLAFGADDNEGTAVALVDAYHETPFPQNYYLQDVNDSNEVVGYYSNNGFTIAAFIEKNGAITTLGPVLSKGVAGDGTYAEGVNNAGDVVGDTETGLGYTTGFIALGGGAMTPIAVAGEGSTWVAGINNSDEVVGYARSGSISFTPVTPDEGFLYKNGSFTIIKVPGASSTQVLDINDAGVMVGNFTDSKGTHGFIDKAGVFTTVDVPIATTTQGEITRLTGINNAGEITGSYMDDREHGGAFVYTEGGLFTIISQGLVPQIHGINNLGTVVGYNYLASAASPPPTVPTPAAPPAPTPTPPPPPAPPATTTHTITSSGSVGATSGDIYDVTANTISVTIASQNTSPVFVHGSGDVINLGQDTASFTLTDDGQGTRFLVPFYTAHGNTISIANFQNDPAGVLTLTDVYATPQAVIAALKPDGHGGSMLALGFGLTLDFVGDTKLTAANFRVGNL